MSTHSRCCLALLPGRVCSQGQSSGVVARVHALDPVDPARPPGPRLAGRCAHLPLEPLPHALPGVRSPGAGPGRFLSGPLFVHVAAGASLWCARVPGIVFTLQQDGIAWSTASRPAGEVQPAPGAGDHSSCRSGLWSSGVLCNTSVPRSRWRRRTIINTWVTVR